jgi:hypothetical protein
VKSFNCVNVQHHPLQHILWVTVVSDAPIARCHGPRMGVCEDSFVAFFAISPPFCRRNAFSEVSIWRIFCLIRMRIGIKQISTIHGLFGC